MVSGTVPLPKYYQLAELLREQIRSGRLGPGDQLPTEEALSRQYGLSRGTVRQAIRLLLDDGLIRSEQGRGTFVRAASPNSTLFTLSGFDEEMRRQKRRPSTELLSAELLPATAVVAERLQLAPETPVIQIARLRLADEEPVAHEVRLLAQNLCPDLLQDDLTNNGIHTLLVFKYQVPLVRMIHAVETGTLSAAQADLLQAEPGSTAFFIDRLTYTEADNERFPAVWFQAIYRADNYHIRAHVQTSL